MPAATSNNAPPPSPEDADLMAVVLEGRHGTFAADVAEFFALLHRQLGDSDRSHAWGGVARTVRKRETERLLSTQ